MGRDDGSIPIGQCIAAESVDHLTTGVLSIVDLETYVRRCEKDASSLDFLDPYIVMSNA